MTPSPPPEVSSTPSHAPHDRISELFRVGMVWRIVYGTARVLLGIVLLRVMGRDFSDLFAGLMQHELAEDPGDILYTLTGALVQHTAFLHHHTHFTFTISYFLVAYFIFWGLIDIFISVGILRGQHWAYGAGMVLIASFVVYEIARVLHTHSLVLGMIILVDIGILALIRREQKIHSASFPHPST